MPGTLRVLIVEDDPDQAQSLAAAMPACGCGCSCETVGSLAEAMTRLSKGGIGCVLLDLTLPDAKETQAVEAITQWRFEPAYKNGHPTQVRHRVSLHFRLDETN